MQAIFFQKIFIINILRISNNRNVAFYRPIKTFIPKSAFDEKTDNAILVMQAQYLRDEVQLFFMYLEIILCFNFITNLISEKRFIAQKN